MRWLSSRSQAERFQAALEIGCGWGAGLREIPRRSTIQRLDAFDLDIRQVALAAQEARQAAERNLWVEDGAAIAARDATYDAVFEFTIFHHIPNWRAALAEVRRVLKPGGLFLFEELSREFFEDTVVLGPILPWGTEHPRGVDVRLRAVPPGTARRWPSSAGQPRKRNCRVAPGDSEGRVRARQLVGARPAREPTDASAARNGSVAVGLAARKSAQRKATGPTIRFIAMVAVTTVATLCPTPGSAFTMSVASPRPTPAWLMNPNPA